jgi:hypothetical protein
MSPVVFLEAPPTPSPIQRNDRDLFVPAFREVGFGYRPGRSFGFSVIFHHLALFLILFFSTHYDYIRPDKVSPARFEPLPSEKVIYLPMLGGGSEGAGQPGGGSGTPAEASSGVRARGRRGFAYPGPQPMVSDPPQSTLGIQTILQPSLKDPPLLRKILPLPNIAQAMLVAPPEPPKPALKVQSAQLTIRPVDKPVQAPKVTLSTADASEVPALSPSQPVMPKPLPPPDAPSLAAISNVPIGKKDRAGLLVLNAVPPAPDVSGKVPLAEARSRFAVAPGEVTVIADPASGAKGGRPDSMAAGNGTAADVASGDAIADAPAGAGSNTAGGGSGTGNGGRYGSGKGAGLNPGVEGTGTGRGTAAKAGTGSGTGTTLGSSNGAGSAPGTGGFPGITIRGGRYGNEPSSGLQPSSTPRRQTSYGMTITSTASSGGGLPDFGVFQNEKVYTVYLDMKASDEDPAPSWTLEYAVLQSVADPAGGDSSNRIVGTPTPPYAILKQIPELTPGLAKCAHKLIVASAIMTAAGKLEQVSVRQAPDSQLVALITEALNNWTFRPAEIGGKPVALKILFGIQLAAR